MSIRTALIGGMLVLATVATGIVGVVGGISIDRGVRREAQSRVDHDLDIVESLYHKSVRQLGREMQGKLESFKWPDDDAGAAERLQQWRRELDLAVLNVCDPDGRPMAGAYPDRKATVPVKTDPVLRRALIGKPACGTVRLEADRLRLEGGAALCNLVAVQSASERPAAPCEAALFQWCAMPLHSDDGQIVALAYGGRALNHNYDMVDSFREMVFGAGGPMRKDKPLGTVTVFLDGTRVATNVLGPHGRRAVGTEVSEDVREEVLHQGRRWQARAWVVDAWYLSGYKPLRDPDGRIVGMLYIGLLEAPYDQLRTRLLTRFLVPVAGVLVLGVAGAWLLARRITAPLRRLRNGARRIADGNWDAQIIEGRSHTEIGALANAFRQMQTAIRQRDQQLTQQNAALAETNDNYMKMLRFVTHELKSPLATTQSMIDMLMTNLLGEVPEKAKQPLVRIKRNCEELQDMVKNYLDLARAEQGELAADKTRIDLLEDVVDPCVTQNDPLFKSRQVTLEINCPGGLTVEADAELLRIALTNYLSNAAKYGREGGRAKLEVSTEADEVTVCVWNEGDGFSKDEAERLFDKFYRLRNENTRSKRGSGLGLYLCRNILDLHDGRAWAESEPGQWARFCFHLSRDASKKQTADKS